MVSTLGFGLLLGIKHAFDADHLIAVSTILHREKQPARAALIGAFWGIGHTSTLLVVGLAVLILKLSIPVIVAERIELVVGIMLVVLGIQAMTRKGELHEHAYTHGSQTHTHPHFDHRHQHTKSFLIGTVHGLAGSGALMVLVLSLINSVWEGMLYILVFGIGSTVSMSMMSLLLGIPVSRSLSVIAKAEQYLRAGIGLVSVAFGSAIIYFTFRTV